MDEYEKMALAEKAFKVIFKDSAKIMTKVVRSGSNTSDVVYVPKKYAKHPVTLIIWNKED